MGPEGGDGGGQLVAMGRPEEIVKVRGSHTGRWLAPLLAAGEPVREAPTAAQRGTTRSGSKTLRAG